MKNRRLISGHRVAARCSMQLPKIDPFDTTKTSREGCLIFNTRGGCFYLAQQYTEHTIQKLFIPGEASVIKDVHLYPDNHEPVLLGDIYARFLHFRQGQPYSGMVLRFSNQSEQQLDALNFMIDTLPSIEGEEDMSVYQIINNI